MNDNLKLTIGVLSMIFVSFTLLFLFNFESIQQNENKSADEFYSQNFDSSESILLYGTSHVGQLNATYIENYLSENNFEYDVYNLALNGVGPEKNNFENTLKLNPKLIVSGIGFFNFEKPLTQTPAIRTIETENNDLIQTIKSSKLIDLDKFLVILSNPKLRMLQFIDRVTGEKIEDEPSYSKKTPFYTFQKVMTKISSEEELLEKYKKHPFRGIDEQRKINTLKNLEQMAQFYKENNVDIIFFFTPSSKYFLDDITEEVTKETVREVEKIAEKYDIKFYSLINEYKNLPIFADPTHVSSHPDALIYSEDVAKIIIQELTK